MRERFPMTDHDLKETRAESTETIAKVLRWWIQRGHKYETSNAMRVMCQVLIERGAGI